MIFQVENHSNSFKKHKYEIENFRVVKAKRIYEYNGQNFYIR